LPVAVCISSTPEIQLDGSKAVVFFKPDAGFEFVYLLDIPIESDRMFVRAGGLHGPPPGY
jgi:hypothetical protein